MTKKSNVFSCKNCIAPVVRLLTPTKRIKKSRLERKNMFSPFRDVGFRSLKF